MTVIFDIDKIRKNRLYALENMQGHGFLFDRACDRMLDNLRDIQRDFKDILIVGARGADPIIKGLRQTQRRNASITQYDVVGGGDEIPIYKNGQFDCIIVMPYLHNVNNVPEFLMAMKRYLRPDGVFLCCFFGGQSLQELRQSILAAELAATGGVSQHVHPMIDHYQFASLLQRAEFALPVVDYDRVVVEYSALQTLYDDLHCMGEGNALFSRMLNINKIKQSIDNNYKNNFFNKGYIATFDIIFGIGWAPHDSQQQPSRRGSGQVSLADIL